MSWCSVHGRDACECVSGPRPAVRPLLAIEPILRAATSILFGSQAGEHLACEDAAEHLGLSVDLVKEALRAAVDSSGLRVAVEGERRATEAARGAGERRGRRGGACRRSRGVVRGDGRRDAPSAPSVAHRPEDRMSNAVPRTTPGFPAYERRNTLTHYLRLFLQATPGVSIAVVGRVFDLDAKRAGQAVKYARHTIAIETRKYRRRVLPVAPSTFLVRGVPEDVQALRARESNLGVSPPGGEPSWRGARVVNRAERLSGAIALAFVFLSVALAFCGR